MTKLPRISGYDLIKYLDKKGWHPVRQSGSHVILKNLQTSKIVPVPLHEELDRGTLLNILEKCGIDRDEFIHGQ